MKLGCFISFVFPRPSLEKAGQTIEAHHIRGAGVTAPPDGEQAEGLISVQWLPRYLGTTSLVNSYYYSLPAVLSVIRTVVLYAWTHVCAKKNIDLFFRDWLNCSNIYSAWDGVFYFESTSSEYSGAKSFHLLCNILLKAITLASLTHKITEWMQLQTEISPILCAHPASSFFLFFFFLHWLLLLCQWVGGTKRKLLLITLCFHGAVWPQSDSF